MHLVDVAVGHYGSSSIVGGGIPIGIGFGLAIKMRGESRVSSIFLGDGAADEGVLYESINFAILKKLPVLFVLENNQYSVCSHVSARQVGEIAFHALPPDLLFTRKVDGNDVLAVYEAAGEAVSRARAGLGPAFLECQTSPDPGTRGVRGPGFCRLPEPRGGGPVETAMPPGQVAAGAAGGRDNNQRGRGGLGTTHRRRTG